MWDVYITNKRVTFKRSATMNGGVRPKIKPEPAVSVRTKYVQEKGTTGGGNTNVSIAAARTTQIKSTDDNLARGAIKSEATCIAEAVKLLEDKARNECRNTWTDLNANKKRSFYIEPELYRKKQNPLITSQKHIAFEEIFSSASTDQFKKAPRTVLLTGAKGSGKSTLAARILSEWAARRSFAVCGFKLAILYNLKEFKNAGKLEDVIINRLSLSLKKDALFSPSIESVLSSVKEKILVVLDGYEDVPLENRAGVKSFLGERSFFQSSIILVTSTTSAADERFSNDFDRTVIIPAVNKDIREHFIDKFFLNDTTNVQKVKEFAKHHHLRFLCEQSFEMLAVVCSVFQNKDRSSKETMKSDYEIIFEFARNLFLHVYDRVYISKPLSEDKANDVFYRLGKLLLQKMKTLPVRLDLDDMESIFKNAKGIVEKLSLFNSTRSGTNIYWELTSTAYVAGLAVHYLNEKLKKLKNVQEIHKILVKHLGDPKNIKTIMFKKGLGFLVFWGQPKEIVYVTLGSHSFYDGHFETFVGIQDSFGDYVARQKDSSLRNLMIYEEKSALSFGERFGDILSANAKQPTLNLAIKKTNEWPNYHSKLTLRFPAIGYIRLAFALENVSWTSKAVSHKSCNEGCKKLNLLPTVLLEDSFMKTYKSKSWNLVVFDQSLCFNIQNRT